MRAGVRRLLARLASPLTGRRDDRDLDDEIREHLALLEARFVRNGLSAAEAHDAARRAFGSVDRTRQLHRDARSVQWLDHLRQDLGAAARTLRTSPALASLAVLTLALGIGATTAAFTQINAVFFTPLAVDRPHQLRFVAWSAADYTFAGPQGRRWQAQGRDRVNAVSGAVYESLRDHHRGFSDVACWSGRNLEVLAAGLGELPASMVTGTFFSTLGVRAVRGRMLTPDDERAGAPPVAVISERLWQRAFARDPGGLGRTLALNDMTFTIVGVAPKGFFGMDPDQPIAVWLPLSLYREMGRGFIDADQWSLCAGVVARLAAGVTDEQARAEGDAVLKHVIRTHHPSAPVDTMRFVLEDASRGTGIVRLTSAVTLPLVLAAVSVLLVIACSSVAGLLLARGAARQREIATRMAFGASRARIVRQLLTESLALSGLSGLAGLAVAYAATPLLPAVLAQLSGATVVIELSPDARVMAFTIAVSAACGLLLGVMPALRATRVDPVAAMKPAAAGSRGPHRAGGGTAVAAQVALSIVLLFAAGLFVRTLTNAQSDWGYDPDRLIRFGVRVDSRLPPTRAQELLSAIERLPGAASATASLWGVFAAWEHPEQVTRVCIAGSTPRSEDDDRVGIDLVAAGFFKTWGVPLVTGQEFDARQVERRERVVIVNRLLAKKFFGSRNPVGEVIGVGATCPGTPVTIIGVAADSTNSPWVGATPLVYRPMPVRADFARVFAIRTTVDSASLVGPVRTLTEQFGLRLNSDVMTGAEIQRRALDRERFLGAALSVFAAIALLISCLGLYGLLVYSVNRRTSEIGIRVALGARRVEIVRAVIADSTLPVLAGLGVGSVAAVGVMQVAESLLYGVSSADPWTLALAALLFLVVAVIASSLPALRALRIDPVTALRHE